MKYAGIKNKTKNRLSPVVVAHVYKAKFRTVKATHRNFVLENKTKERKRKERETITKSKNIYSKYAVYDKKY